MEGQTRIQKLWRAFNAEAGTADGTVHYQQRKCQMKTLFRDVFQKLLLIRTVHAAKDENETKTSFEKLSAGRPQIVVSDEEVRQYLNKETGMDRLRELFFKGEDGQIHPELFAMSLIIQTSSALVFAVTSVFGAKAAREAYLIRQKHHVFPTKFTAMRAYNDAVMVGAFKFGGKWAIKTFIFSSLFLLTSHSIATFRNKTSVLEYVAGGALTGALLRLNLGIRGFIAGGVIGSFLGAVGGTLFYITQTLAGDTQQQRHYWRIQERLRNKKEVELLLSSKSGEPSKSTEDNAS